MTQSVDHGRHLHFDGPGDTGDHPFDRDISEQVPGAPVILTRDGADDASCMTVPVGVQPVQLLGFDPQRDNFTLTNAGAVAVSIGTALGIIFGGPNTVQLPVGASRDNVRAKCPWYAVAQAAGGLVDVLVERDRNA